MSTEFQPSDEFAKLLAQLVENHLDADGARRLNEIVADDPSACDFYVDYVSVHAMLDWRHGRVPVLEIPIAEPEAVRPRPFPWIPVIVANLLVALSVGILFWGTRGDPTGSNPGIATVIGEQDAIWSVKNVADDSQQFLDAGSGNLASGTARIKLDNGVILALSGPVEFELLNENRFQLDRGILRAYAPPAARGFTVVAADTEIVDLGTEFGVSVDKHNDVEVHVFTGEVVVIVPKDRIVLKAREARRVDHKCNVSKVRLRDTRFPPIEAAGDTAR